MNRLSPPFSTPQTRAALDHVRAFVRSSIPPGLLDAKAMALAFQPPAKIDSEIEIICDEMRSGFDDTATKAFAFSCTLAFATLLRERIAEFEAMERGRA